MNCGAVEELGVHDGIASNAVTIQFSLVTHFVNSRLSSEKKWIKQVTISFERMRQPLQKH